MCRLFGLIANKEVDISFSMLEARNNFKKQGLNNPHGWGIGWFENNIPKVEKHGENAFYSKKFDKSSRAILSKIVIAHVRYASSGKASLEKNSHPFIYKNWIFAHNGTIKKDRIFNLLKTPYNSNFTSQPIDSEVYFRYVIQCIEEEKSFIEGIKKCVKEVIKDCRGANFVLADEKNLYAFKYERPLFYLLRDPRNPFYAQSKETLAIIEAKKLAEEKAILIASEKITEQEDWKPLNNGELLITTVTQEIKKESLL